MATSTDERELEAKPPWILGHIHPEGWVYHSRVWPKDPKGIELHEIRGALNNVLNPAADFDPSVSYDPSVVAEFGGLIAHAYVDTIQFYAAKTKEQLSNYDVDHVNELRLDYWKFMWYFPSHRELPLSNEFQAAARQALECYVMEGMIVKSDAQAPFTLSESKELLQYINDHLRGSVDVDVDLKVPSQTSAFTRLVAWILLNVAQHRIKTKYGNKTLAESQQDAHPRRPTIWFQLVSTCFLFAPLGQRKHIHAAKKSSELRGDVNTWPTYIKSLAQEWKTFNLAATVLLSASIGFLAVPGIDSFTRAIALLSAAFTLGSIMTSVYLLWRHQAGRVEVEYHISLLQPGFQIDVLAIILSTPFVFLVWGVILFLVSVISYSFLGSELALVGTPVPVLGWGKIAILVSNVVIALLVFGAFCFFRVFHKPISLKFPL